MAVQTHFVCGECGQLISLRKRRRHRERCYPRGPIGIGAPGFNAKAQFRSVWPRAKLKSVSKY